ncbi:unnamed protein product, partial [Clonostachys solani]
MANQDGVYGTFTIASGCMCFGSLHNIWGGSLAPVQLFRQVKPQPSGTVSAHELKHNIAAVKLLAGLHAMSMWIQIARSRKSS